MSSNLKVISFILIFIGLVITGFVYKVKQSEAEPELSALVYPIARPLPDFEMMDHQGERFDNDQFLGKWSVVFFGFTNCPTICPTIMADLNKVAKSLAPKTYKEIQFVFISIDPERDTVERLSQYIPHYNPDFIGLTSDLDTLTKLTKSMGVAFLKVPMAGSDNYDMQHSDRLFIIDPHGRRYGIFASHPTSPGKVDVTQVVLDLETLVRVK
jgi:protein SCO1